MSNTDCLQGVVAYNLQYANGKQYKTENSLANFLSTLNPEESFKKFNIVRPFLVMDYLLSPSIIYFTLRRVLAVRCGPGSGHTVTHSAQARPKLRPRSRTPSSDG